MDTGEVGCEWRDGESLRTSYLFVSRKRDVIVKRITSTSPDLEMTLAWISTTIPPGIRQKNMQSMCLRQRSAA